MDDIVSFDLPLRKCNRCLQLKPLDAFAKNKNASDGLQYWCRECCRQNWQHYAKDPLRGQKGRGHKAEIAEPNQIKQCTVCKQFLPLDDFYPTKDRKGKYGRRPNCKTCSTRLTLESRHKNPQKHTENSRRWRERNKEQFPELSRNHRLQSRYGITSEEYDVMFAAQFGLCAICGKAPKNGKLEVDHCHKTHVIRELTCHHCNCLLGHARDDISVLENAVKYLRKHET